MSLLLVALVFATAANPVRLAVAARGDRRSLISAAGALLVTTFVLAWLSGPINNLVGISVPSAVIAAGIAVVVIGARDALISPPRLEPSPTSVPVAVFPLFFPTMFSPAVALMAVASGAERGVAPSSVAMLAGITIAIGTAVGLPNNIITSHPKVVRALAGFIGVGGVAVGALMATHGVMSI